MLAVCAFSPAGLRAQAQRRADSQPPPTAEEVLKRAIARAKWSDEQHFEGKFLYTEHVITEEHDSQDQVKKREEHLYHVFPIEGEPYSQLVEKDGKSLDAKDAKHEKEREQKFRAQIAERKRKRQEKKKDPEDVEFNEELAGRYDWVVTGREAVNGRTAIVMGFQPKPGKLPERRRIDRLLNRVAGRVWVDEQDAEIARVDLHLAENVSAWGGLLASVKRVFLRFEQVKVDESAWLPSAMDLHIEGRIFLKSLHVHVVEDSRDFRRATATSVTSH